METDRKTEHQSPGSLHIARPTFELLKRRFEPLGDDEACIEIAG
jgi:hypothetical protein